VLIGEPIYYYLLYNHDEEFQKLFKIKADFDVEMDRTSVHIRDYARLISTVVCSSEKLCHFDPGAVARVVDYGSRMAEDQRKLSTLFNKLVEIIYEANGWACYEKAEIVRAEHVQKAIAEKKYRSAMIEEKIQEQIDQDSLMINVFNRKAGELNGLAYMRWGITVWQTGTDYRQDFHGRKRAGEYRTRDPDERQDSQQRRIDPERLYGGPICPRQKFIIVRQSHPGTELFRHRR
jgi:predicted ATP-dependent protease